MRLGCLVAVWIAAVCVLGCGGGSVIVGSGKPGNPVTGEPGETNIGSPLPSSVRIPNGSLGGRYAYVVTTAPPLGLFRYDLEGEAPYGFVFYDLFGKIRGIPDELLILDAEHAFLTTSGGIQGQGEGIHLFDPTPPSPEAFSLIEDAAVFPLHLDPPRPDSQGNPVSELLPSYTSGVAVSQGKIYVCTSNFTATGGNPVCPPGTVLIYRWDTGSAPPSITPSEPSFLVTTAFNPTEVTALGERAILVTNTGVVAVRNARAVPMTEGSVDVVDTDLDCIVARYPLGLGAPSYKPIAITPDRSRALLGSVAYNAVYELDLTAIEDHLGSCPDTVPDLSEAVLAGEQDPILVGGASVRANDFIVQVGVNGNATRAYATGYNSGTLSILEVETRAGMPSPKSAAEVVRLTPALDPQAPTLEEVGPGPLAVRPGRPGIDFSGPDLFVLTGLPTGKMLSLETY